MKRRTFIFGGAATAAVGVAAVAQVSAPATRIEASETARALIEAAETQVGVTWIYDPSYVRLDFPGGDVPLLRGVCTDVVIRAFRNAYGIDLQVAVNTDMKANFSAYPKIWGLKRPDRNIDHRRVPNLAKLFQRMGAEKPLTTDPAAFEPGDVVASVLPGNQPHVMIVTDRPGRTAPKVVHNIGLGARIADALLDYPLTGHYRMSEDVLAQLRALQG